VLSVMSKNSAQIEVEFSAFKFFRCTPRVVVFVAVLAALSNSATVRQFIAKSGEGFLRRFSNTAPGSVTDRILTGPKAIKWNVPKKQLKNMAYLSYIVISTNPSESST